MGVVIRLQKAGNRNRPFYRVVVTDSRKPRDGAFLEKVGYYNPIPDPDQIHLERERIDVWMGKGAKPTTAVAALIKRADKRGGEVTGASEDAPQAPVTVEEGGAE